MHTVRLATCAAFPAGDEDGAALVDALARDNVDARWTVWDDPGAVWDDAPVVLRSTWDYTLRRDRFLTWADTVPVLHNPAPVARWNSDKTYLLDLAAAGVAITPTTVLVPGAPIPAPDAEVVIKPSVGAGSRGAGRFPPARADAARAHAEALWAAGRTALLQPYLAAVDGAGETALVYLDGEFSHAVRKGPMLGRHGPHALDESTGLFIEENISARMPSTAELALGRDALAVVRARFGTPLYARVDLLPGPDGPVVVELELVEPSLFLSCAYADADADADTGSTAGAATEKFAAAIARRL